MMTDQSTDNNDGRFPTMTSWVDAAARLRDAGLSFPLGVDLDGRMSFARRTESATVIGKSQSGKTSGFINPAVALHVGPAVVTSHKPDIRDATLAARRAMAHRFGGQIFELAVDEAYPLRDGAAPVSLDIINGADHWPVALDRGFSLARASEAVGTTVSDTGAHFSSAAAKFLAVALFVAASRGWSMATLLAIFDRRRTDLLNDYLEERVDTDPDALAAHQTLDSIVGQGGTSDRELAGIYSTITTRILAGLRYLAASRTPGLRTRDLLAGASTLYITVRDERAANFAALISSQIEILTADWRAGLRHSAAGPLLLALDEIANVAPFSSLPSLITGGRGDDIQVLAVLQDPGQASRWGADGGTVLHGATWDVVFPGVSDATFLAAKAQLYGRAYTQDLVREIRPNFIQRPNRPDAPYYLRERALLDHIIESSPPQERAARAEIAAMQLAIDRLEAGYLSPDGLDHRAIMDDIYSNTTTSYRTDRRDRVEVNDLTSGQGQGLTFVGNHGNYTFRRFPRLFSTGNIEQNDELWWNLGQVAL
jgi:hypothetical protein